MKSKSFTVLKVVSEEVADSVTVVYWDWFKYDSGCLKYSPTPFRLPPGSSTSVFFSWLLFSSLVSFSRCLPSPAQGTKEGCLTIIAPLVWLKGFMAQSFFTASSRCHHLLLSVVAGGELSVFPSCAFSEVTVEIRSSSVTEILTVTI